MDWHLWITVAGGALSAYSAYLMTRVSLDIAQLQLKLSGDIANLHLEMTVKQQEKSDEIKKWAEAHFVLKATN